MLYAGFHGKHSFRQGHDWWSLSHDRDQRVMSSNPNVTKDGPYTLILSRLIGMMWGAAVSQWSRYRVMVGMSGVRAQYH
ncbi:hypothetical protein TNCV_4647831 [Trichonephila clavipes]|uniref:Uncharacterized protein n=1 Tax=Trichonephila clavipes TaxID=2585209 RepID=A0A8X6T3X7_TRICX|nr:hypothetical protein TNCV_4647831 [Trichonephila clavipes]